MASSSSIHSSSLSRNWEYDVFVSFHDKDVRRFVLSHILKEFKNKGINPFIDNEIKRGKFIGPELKKTIHGSRIAIALLSKRYASSSWCLEELAEIMKCRKELDQTVITIFYDVDPTDVKKQTGDFGKTTIARCLFNEFSSRYQLSAFVENIKAPPCSDYYGALLYLQQQFLSQITNQKDFKISHLGVAQDRLKGKKVLVVLDNVTESVQLDAMAEKNQWFGSRSRVIITTQDRCLLRKRKISFYKVDYPTNEVAFQIFCMYAFKQKFPYDGFEELSREVTRLSGDLPLGLQVIGSYFHGMSKEEWMKNLPRLRTQLDGEIQSKLQFSYDALFDVDKDLFLYIACLFNNKHRKKVEGHLAKNIRNVSEGLEVLADKSLISISDYGYIKMHHLLAQLGKEIVRKQSIHEPGKRQFLVNAGDIRKVVTDDKTIARSVIGIRYGIFEQHELLAQLRKALIRQSLVNAGDNCKVLTGDKTIAGSVIGINHDHADEDNEFKYISGRALEGMANLQFLRFGSGVKMTSTPGCLTNISPKLRLIEWKYSSMTCFPFTDMECLVELNMSNSKLLEKLWEGNKPLPNLKWMDLSHCENLKEVPDLSTATNLEKLNLRHCIRLVELPSSIGNATNLRKLNLFCCSSLKELPSSIWNATNLQILNLGCSGLVKLPSFIENATNLRELNLEDCPTLVEVPSSIEYATSLEKLNLFCCSSLKELPSSIWNATNLQILDLERCSGLVKLPSFTENATNLRELNLQDCSTLVEVPSSIEYATSLEKLNLKDCSSLEKLPSTIGNLHKLFFLEAENCISLERLHCSFCNPEISLNFGGCFELNQTARDLIIRTSTCGLVVLPGVEVPDYFTHRASQSSVTVKLNQKPLRTSTEFKACILVHDPHNFEYMRARVNCSITSKENARTTIVQDLNLLSPDHLYIFQFGVKEVTSTELDFNFWLEGYYGTCRILECGVLQLLELHDESSSKRRRLS